MMRKICEVIFSVNDSGKISTQFSFDNSIFLNEEDQAKISNVLEGLHYDFLYRMEEEGFVKTEIKLDS